MTSLHLSSITRPSFWGTGVCPAIAGHPQTYSDTQGQFRASGQPLVQAFGLWEEAGVPGENPRKHSETKKVPKIPASYCYCTCVGIIILMLCTLDFEYLLSKVCCGSPFLTLSMVTRGQVALASVSVRCLRAAAVAQIPTLPDSLSPFTSPHSKSHVHHRARETQQHATKAQI